MFIDGLRLSSFAVFRYGMDECGVTDGSGGTDLEFQMGSDLEFLVSVEGINK